MDRFKSILVAASPGHLDARPLREAVKLAAESGARLTVLDVIPPVSRFRRMVQVEGRVIDVQTALLDDRRETLRQLMDNTRTPEGTPLIVKAGEPFIEAIRHVIADGHDLVVVGGRSVARGDLPGLDGGLMHLVRKCPTPVWMIRPLPDGRRCVVALVDPDPEDSVRDQLNDLVLELAASLARRRKSELHVGHAWTLEGESTLRSSPYVKMPGRVVDMMVGSMETIHREAVDDLLARHDLEGVAKVHLVRGDPGKALPRLVDDLGGDVVVMGTVARTGLSGLIMGNTAETVLRAVRCSVVAVKPTGFVSPVKVPDGWTADTAIESAPPVVGS